MWKKIEESIETGNEHYLLSFGNSEYRLYRTTRTVDHPIEDDYMIEKYDNASDEYGMINKNGEFVFGWGIFNAIGPKPDCHWPLDKAKEVVENLIDSIPRCPTKEDSDLISIVRSKRPRQVS